MFYANVKILKIINENVYEHKKKRFLRNTLKEKITFYLYMRFGERSKFENVEFQRLMPTLAKYIDKRLKEKYIIAIIYHR